MTHILPIVELMTEALLESKQYDENHHEFRIEPIDLNRAIVTLTDKVTTNSIRGTAHAMIPGHAASIAWHMYIGLHSKNVHGHIATRGRNPIAAASSRPARLKTVTNNDDAEDPLGDLDIHPY